MRCVFKFLRTHFVGNNLRTFRFKDPAAADATPKTARIDHIFDRLVGDFGNFIAVYFGRLLVDRVCDDDAFASDQNKIATGTDLKRIKTIRFLFQLKRWPGRATLRLDRNRLIGRERRRLNNKHISVLFSNDRIHRFSSVRIGDLLYRVPFDLRKAIASLFGKCESQNVIADLLAIISVMPPPRRRLQIVDRRPHRSWGVAMAAVRNCDHPQFFPPYQDRKRETSRPAVAPMKMSPPAVTMGPPMPGAPNLRGIGKRCHFVDRAQGHRPFYITFCQIHGGQCVPRRFGARCATMEKTIDRCRVPKAYSVPTMGPGGPTRQAGT